MLSYKVSFTLNVSINYRANFTFNHHLRQTLASRIAQPDELLRRKDCNDSLEAAFYQIEGINLLQLSSPHAQIQEQVLFSL